MARWKIDPDHAVGEFTVYHMMVTPVHGQFNTVRGQVLFDPADPGSASVEVEIDTKPASIRVSNEGTTI